MKTGISFELRVTDNEVTIERTIMVRKDKQTITTREEMAVYQHDDIHVALVHVEQLSRSIRKGWNDTKQQEYGTKRSQWAKEA